MKDRLTYQLTEGDKEIVSAWVKGTITVSDKIIVKYLTWLNDSSSGRRSITPAESLDITRNMIASSRKINTEAVSRNIHPHVIMRSVRDIASVLGYVCESSENLGSETSKRVIELNSIERRLSFLKSNWSSARVTEILKPVPHARMLMDYFFEYNGTEGLFDSLDVRLSPDQNRSVRRYITGDCLDNSVHGFYGMAKRYIFVLWRSGAIKIKDKDFIGDIITILNSRASGKSMRINTMKRFIAITHEKERIPEDDSDEDDNLIYLAAAFKRYSDQFISGNSTKQTRIEDLLLEQPYSNSTGGDLDWAGLKMTENILRVHLMSQITGQKRKLTPEDLDCDTAQILKDAKAEELNLRGLKPN